MTHVVAAAWLFVVLLVAVVEATSPQGSVLGALGTVLAWAVLPLGLLLYVMGATARIQRRRQANKPTAASTADADGRGHAPGDAVAAEREEP
jgi:hypothetical protein